VLEEGHECPMGEDGELPTGEMEVIIIVFD